MKNFKSLTIWTIVLDFFILIGAGHGIGFIGLIEIFWIMKVLSGKGINDEIFSLSLMSSYEASIVAVILFAFAGQLFLIFSIIVKSSGKIFWLKIIGLSCLWISFFYLTHNLFNNSASLPGFLSGIPFIICSGLLVYRIINQRN